jgi:hypothetical protein
MTLASITEITLSILLNFVLLHLLVRMRSCYLNILHDTITYSIYIYITTDIGLTVTQ